jgi:hypothetical protein
MRRTQRLAQGAGLWCYWMRGPAKSSSPFLCTRPERFPLTFTMKLRFRVVRLAVLNSDQFSRRLNKDQISLIFEFGRLGTLRLLV